MDDIFKRFEQQKRMRAFFAVKYVFDALSHMDFVSSNQRALRKLRPLFFKDIKEYDIHFPYYHEDKAPGTLSLLNFDKTRHICTTFSRFIAKKHPLLFAELAINVLPLFEEELRYYFIKQKMIKENGSRFNKQSVPNL